MYPTQSYEKVVRIDRAELGLRGWIVVHSTKLGPALGGLRCHPYTSSHHALADAMRLAEGMTEKAALADLPLGGGKAVLELHPNDKSPELLEAFGEQVNLLEGDYITAEDLNVTEDDLRIVSRRCAHVAGLGRLGSSADPSPATARGVFEGLQAAVKVCFGEEVDESSLPGGLQGLRVGVQGLGAVGMKLCRLLHHHGARLVVADVERSRALYAERNFDAEIVAVDELLASELDVLAPCALGGVLNANTIPTLRAKAIVGGANNQLERPEVDARALFDRGIVWAPDIVVNAGGLIHAYHYYFNEISLEPDDLRGIYDRTSSILQQSIADGLDCRSVCIQRLESRFRHEARQLRSNPLKRQDDRSRPPLKPAADRSSLC